MVVMAFWLVTVCLLVVGLDNFHGCYPVLGEYVVGFVWTSDLSMSTNRCTVFGC